MNNNINIRLSLLVVLAALLGPLFIACENSNEVGTELVSDEVTIVADSSFTLKGRSIISDAVLSRTVMQLIGNVEVPEYGHISSDFVTQFMPANAIDTAGVTVNSVDSLKLVMLVNYGGYVGDTLAIMGMEVYPLVKQLETPMYSNFNPEGYYDASQLLGSTVYNLTKGAEPDSLQDYAYYTLSVNLPVEMGRKFFLEYINNPATFNNPTTFAQYFPGLYVKNSYGSGRITRISNTSLRMYYHKNYVNTAGNDTTVYKIGNYFAVTPEIITNNDIALNMSSYVQNRVDAGDVIMLAPVGMDVELEFPALSIIQAYRSGTQDALGVINLLTMEIPVEDIENKYDIGAPTDVVLLLKKDRESFFLQNKLPDDKTSFKATLTTLSNGSQGYAFANLRQYFIDLLSKDNITEDDYTFVLMPVNVTTESSSDYYGNTTATVTAITPYVTEPKMTQILLDKVKINFVYSKQTTKI